MTLRFSARFAFIPLLITLSARAGNSGKTGRGPLQKPASTSSYHPFLINGVFNYYGNNGDGSYNPYSTDNEGFEFFKGSGKHLVFEDGVIWGGILKGENNPRIGGSAYRHALQPGPILQAGTAGSPPLAADTADPRYRLFRVRPDFNPRAPFSLVGDRIQSSEAAYITRYEHVSPLDIYNQYVKDWNEWPAALGAPFTYGVDASGRQRTPPASYDPAYDIPGRPGADQTLWYVANDMDTVFTEYFAQTPPIGIEMRRTIWGYHRPGPFDNAVMMSTVIINKSGREIDSMYLGQWGDPDVGDAGDDFSGCDTTRNLGYAYNAQATDAVYGQAIPAAGFVLLQGPVVASPVDSAIFMARRIYGVKNLPMTSFGYFFPEYVQIIYNINWYCALEGLARFTCSPYISPVTQQPTKFPVSGDPVPKDLLGSYGWIDGMAGVPPGDRQLLMSSGPFVMAPGDTQEFVVATLAGLGADYLSSISVLREEVDAIRVSYRDLLASASPPPSPVVTVAPMDGEILLTWGDSVTLARTERSVDHGYTFEGYNVYEYPSPANADAVLLGTFDVADGLKTIADTVYDPLTGLYLTKVLQVGTDKGAVHSVDIKTSSVRKLPLANGNRYYFAVTAYSYNPRPPAFTGTHSLESVPQILTVVPQSPNPGTRYHQARGDQVPVSLATSPGYPVTDVGVFASVVDPTRITGDAYVVTFTHDSATGTDLYGITDQTKGKSLASRQSYEKAGSGSLMVDGVQVDLTTPAGGMKLWLVPSGVRRWSPVGADIADVFHLEGFQDACDVCPRIGSIGNARDHWYTGGVPYNRLATILIRFAPVDSVWDPKGVPADSNFSRGYRYLSNSMTDPMTLTPPRPEFIPWIMNKGAGFVYQDYNYGIPFSAWNVDVTPPRRLAVGHIENVANAGHVDGKYLPPVTGQSLYDNVAVGEWFFIFDAPYTDPVPDPALTVDIRNVATPMMWFGLPVRRGNYSSAGDQFEIVAYHPNGAGNTFLFSTIAPTLGDKAISQADVTQINVYPNPYMRIDGTNPGSVADEVTFTHLPVRAIIRIYTLAGILVKSILKEDPGQFVRWDVRNESGNPAASGIYLVHIQMPDLGSTKTLKLGIISEKY